MNILITFLNDLTSYNFIKIKEYLIKNDEIHYKFDFYEIDFKLFNCFFKKLQKFHKQENVNHSFDKHFQNNLITFE